MNRLFLILLASVLITVKAQATMAQSDTADYTVNVVASELDQPWSVAFLPDNEYLIALRPGQIVRVDAQGNVSEPFAGVPSTYYYGQGGFFDIVLDPEFASNNFVYLSFAHGDAENNATRVVRAELGASSLDKVTPIFTANISKDTGAHYGGRIAFLPDATLLLTTGDGFQYRDKAQDKNNHMGKVVRFTRDGDVPADNPFASNESGKNEGARLVYSFGHRNPQGLAVDPVSGMIFQHEHGPKGGDEVNIIEAGENYGWPVATYGINYSGALVSPHQSVAGMVDGIHGWTPSIAPSGLAVYRGEMFPEWEGDLLLGALVDQEVVRLEIENGKVTTEESIIPEIAARVRDVRVAADGAIYVLTDGPTGSLYRISR